MGLRLGGDVLPHVTLTQQFVPANDLDAVLDRVGAALAGVEALRLMVTGPAGSELCLDGDRVQRRAERASSATDGRLESRSSARMARRGICRWRRAAGDVALGRRLSSHVEPRGVHAAHHAGACRGPARRRATDLRRDHDCACHLGKFCTCRRVLQPMGAVSPVRASRVRSPQPEASVSIAHGSPASVSLRSCWSSSSRRSPSADAGRVPPVVSRGRTPSDAGRGDVHRRSGRSARTANEPLVAGPLRASRVREERVRRPRSPTTAGKALTRGAPQPARVGRAPVTPAPCA